MEKYFNYLDYLIDNLENYDLNHTDILFMLLIANYNQRGKSLGREAILKKLDIDSGKLNLMMKKLMADKFIAVSMQSSSNFEAFFKNNPNSLSIIIKLVEEILHRPIGHSDFQKIKNWLEKYPFPEVLELLKNCLGDYYDINALERYLNSNIKHESTNE